LFGKGAYFADTAVKSDNYSSDYEIMGGMVL
jgi:hypothetical protein